MSSRLPYIRRLLVTLACCSLGVVPFTATQAEFEGEVVATWLEDPADDDRQMRLQQPFAFTGSDGTRWEVPSGAIVDGASIPRIFWSAVGPPFVGDYRRASVLHDYYCQVKLRPWQLVHRMFYEASVAGGVSATKAKTMYAAVFIGGPRWPEPGALGATVRPNPTLNAEEFQELTRWIEDNEPSLKQIENRIQELD